MLNMRHGFGSCDYTATLVGAVCKNAIMLKVVDRERTTLISLTVVFGGYTVF